MNLKYSIKKKTNKLANKSHSLVQINKTSQTKCA